MYCGAVWCGVVWCGVMWFGVVCAVPCCALCYAVVCCVVVCCGVVQSGWLTDWLNRTRTVDFIALGQYNEAHHLNSVQQCNRIAPASQ